jgi:S1-C subfamily serine protease
MPKSSQKQHSHILAFLYLALFIWATFIAFYAPDIAAFHARHVADHAQNSVVRLTLFLNDGREGVCTGVVIADKLILTAAHCTDEKDGNVVGINADDAPAQVVAVDEHFDLALLTSVAAQSERRPAITISDAPMFRGDHMTAIGYAGGATFLVQMHGTLMLQAAETSSDISPCVIASYIGIPGMSGGPVIDGRGRLISIVSRGITGVSCGMNTEIIRVFLYSALGH